MDELNDIQVNYKSGWIRIYRSIKKHWLYPKNRPLTELEAWITILIEVNHESEKVRLGYDIFECNKGEKYYSLDTWAKVFNWNKSKVRRFFILLQNDSMIETKSVQKTTHLTVCNYESYQGYRNDNETMVKRKRNDGETEVTPIEEYNKDKEKKKDYIYSKFYDSQIENCQNEKYIKFVKYLFGDNMFKLPLTGVLSINKQLSVSEFEIILDKCATNKTKLGDILTKMENDKKYYKGKTNLYRTLLNWAEDKFVK